MTMRRPGSLFVRAVVAASLLAGASADLVEPAAATRPAQSTGELPPPKAQIVVDATTGAVLAGDHVHDALYPASLVKIMTALVAVERLPANETIPVSALAAGKPPMKITMHEGQRWPLEHAIASMMMVSANDAAFAIAEHVGGGSIEGFADVATDAAERLGLRDSTISDPSGLDDESSHDGGSRMSAYDLAVVTRNALSVPVIAKYAAMPEFSFTDPAGRQRYLPNHNKMVVEGGYRYGGASGFKTGYTDKAQHTLVATATRDGRTLIAVLLGAPTYGYAEAAALLDLGFSTPADADGTGERLPEITVSPYATRLADQQAFAALASSTSASDGTTAAVSSVPVEAAAPLAARGARSSQSGDEGADEGSGGGGGGGLLSTRNVIIVAVVLLLTLVMLRRRAVKRQRARRITRQRARAAQMRSGGLPVVDGKYRAGMRLGPPVESHVRVRRVGGDEPRRRGTG
jgi:D-alanyl-D-alanine carboxypeptidase